MTQSVIDGANGIEEREKMMGWLQEWAAIFCSFSFVVILRLIGSCKHKQI